MITFRELAFEICILIVLILKFIINLYKGENVEYMICMMILIIIIMVQSWNIFVLEDRIERME